jgi:hypothetical protein
LLQIDPRQRPTIKSLVESIEDLAIGNDVGLNEPLLFLFNPNETNTSTSSTSGIYPSTSENQRRATSDVSSRFVR